MILIDDLSRLHNVHVVGAGLNRRTSVAGMGNSHWEPVTLRPGKLTFYSDRAPTKRRTITVVS